MDLGGHILNICLTNDITIRRATNSNIRAIHFNRIIEIDLVMFETDYAAALHEIGHILGSTVDRSFVIEDEAEAWKWAEENALIWTETMSEFRKEKLLKYINNARNGKKYRGIYPINVPGKDHFVWKYV